MSLTQPWSCTHAHTGIEYFFPRRASFKGTNYVNVAVKIANHNTEDITNVTVANVVCLSVLFCLFCLFCLFVVLAFFLLTPPTEPLGWPVAAAFRPDRHARRQVRVGHQYRYDLCVCVCVCVYFLTISSLCAAVDMKDTIQPINFEIS